MLGTGHTLDAGLVLDVWIKVLRQVGGLAHAAEGRGDDGY